MLLLTNSCVVAVVIDVVVVVVVVVLGGAIGIIFSLANAVAVALYVVGFAETVADLFTEYTVVFTGNRTNDIRVIGYILVTLLLVVALVGLNFEAKVSNPPQDITSCIGRLGWGIFACVLCECHVIMLVT